MLRKEKTQLALEIAGGLFILLLVCGLLALMVSSIGQENVCMNNGYDQLIFYNHVSYCFGRNGEPLIAELKSLPIQSERLLRRRE